ncbi:ribokinase [Liquorilactobacillus sicerae]|uniref:ribokinase n=1 Tax=Liquorilactobacillus sicerae TaxID=1416943 RepID=UPI00247FDB84|nr:ribokinase [Liquorilactobacillus sicerae]
MNKVTIIGSLNIDTTFKVSDFPLPGETIKALNKSSAAGGKGANQAVAAARLGAKTTFIGKVGNDQQGKFMTKALKHEGIDISGIKIESTAGTGTADILLNERGQNCIIVYGGANQTLTVADLAGLSQQIATSDFVVAQFETPQTATVAAFKIAKAAGKTTILNPAPASELSPELFSLTDIIVPNESENQKLTGIKITDLSSMKKSAAKFAGLGIPKTIITLGSQGVFYAAAGQAAQLAAFKVKTVDPTAAGDTFIGAFVAKLSPTMENFVEAINYAQKASALTVQRLGAQVSIPTVAQVSQIFDF